MQVKNSVIEILMRENLGNEPSSESLHRTCPLDAFFKNPKTFLNYMF